MVDHDALPREDKMESTRKSISQDMGRQISSTVLPLE